MTNSAESAVPEPIRQLLDVFETHLGDVQFPGVDAASLRAQADAVEATATTLEAAEAAVLEARRAHGEAFTALKTSAERGMGYARVFGTDDATLTEALEPIALAQKASRRKLPPKKRGRKPKAKPDNVAELPLQAESA
ncbi:MAG: hypothetical protein AAGA54_29180 [Myxococcota bacterium]